MKILCVKADPYVTVVCTEHTSQSDCVDYMSKIQNSAISDGKKLQNSLQNGDITSSGSVNFVEGIALRKDQVVTITATFLSKADVDSLDKKRKKELQYCNGIGNKWFFNQVRDSVRKASNALKKIKNNDKNNGYYRKNKEVGQDSEHGGVVSSENIVVGKFILPLKDYLFRHDQGSFWMASYRIPQIIGRFMGPLLDSTNMFRLATALPWAFPKNTIVLQDFILPNSNVKDFFTSMEDQLDVWPVWLLPMRNIPSEGSLFASPKGLGDQHLCNVGAYGIPRKKYDFIQANKKLEELLYEFNGRKVYYSHAFYARDFFYEILYDGLKYFQLRNRYCHDEALPEIFDKIITHNGKL